MSEVSLLSETINPDLLVNDIQVLLVNGNGTDEALLEIGSISPYSLLNRSKFDFDLKRFVPGLPLRIEDFPQLLSDIVTNAQDRAGIVDTERVTVVQAYEPDMFSDLKGVAITYRILNRMPANLSRDGKSRPQRLPTYSYEYVSSLEPNKYLLVESRPLDHDIEISVWSKTYTLANTIALWLERLLISERWQFTSRGVKPFFFKGRSADTFWNPNARLTQIPMKFFARLQEYNILALPTIKEINMILENK